MDNIISTNIYGNEFLKEMLLSSCKSNRLSHSYLFYGNDGIGKQTMSYFLAALVLCNSELKPCYECNSCRKLLSGNHPDFHVIEKDDDKTLISIDTIRKVRLDSFIKANDGINKVFLIKNAHFLSNEASNALLKVLEEPTKNTLFIFTTTNKQLVKETILSRCICFEMFPIDKSLQKDILKIEFPQKSDEEILNACISSNGNIGQAKLLLNSNDSNEILNSAKLTLNFLSQNDEYSLLSEFTKYKDNKKDLSCLLINMIDILHENLLSTIAKTYNSNDDMDLIPRYIEILEDAINKISSNLNTNLIIANLSIDLTSDTI